MLNRIKETLQKIIDIRPQEKRLSRMLFLHSLLIGFASSCYIVEASRSFILHISIGAMPTAYIVSGMTGYLLIRLFKYWQGRIGIARSFEWMLLLFACSMFALYLGKTLFAGQASVVRVLAYLGFVGMFAFAALFALGFAGICLSVFNLSQSKRLLALLGSGEVLASILAYLFLPVLVKWLGGTNLLLLIAAGIALLSILPVFRIQAEKKEALLPKKTSRQKVSGLSPAQVWQSPFLRYLTLTTLLSIVSVYFIDYSYLISVRFFAQSTGTEVSTVVAMIFTCIKSGELFFSLFSANLLASAGMKKAVLSLPFLLIAGTVLGIFSVVVFAGSPVFMIFFLFLNKWIDRVFRRGLTNPSMKIMFQVNTPEERIRLQNNIDGIISQLSTIVCGGLLTLLIVFENTADAQRFLTATTILCLLIFLVFFWLSNRLYLVYRKRIQEYLQGRKTKAAPVETHATNVARVGDTRESPAFPELEVLMNRYDCLQPAVIRELLMTYHPSLETYSHFEIQDTTGEKEWIRKITKLYFDQSHPVTRLLVIAYFRHLGFEQQWQFFQDTCAVTPMRIRYFFLQQLIACRDMKSQPHRFFLEELVTETIGEMMWTETAMADIEPLQARQLQQQLENHHRNVQDTLLAILSLIYDPHAIRMVNELLHNRDRGEEDLLFIVELLENMLDEHLKKLVIPVFEPIAFHTRHKKLSA
ncbi:MAG TPA: MFS transporter, partial [Sediminibacterium sp.]|nr:MFS transporter [Sediminibacterium sp.]